MSAKKTCARGGHIGGDDLWLPETTWDRDIGALYPRVGCTELVCSECAAPVRFVLGHRLKGDSSLRKTGVPAGVALETALPLVADPFARTYACACIAYTAIAIESMEADGDDWHDPKLPWRCAGHTPLVLPATVDGVHLADDGDWDAVVAEALAGLSPRGWHPTQLSLTRHPAIWLARIVAHLVDADLADAIAARVGPHLTSPAAVIRRAAVNFYRHRPGAPGADGLGPALRTHSALYVGVTLPETGTRDLADELRECVGVQLANAPTPAIADAVKAELLSGRGTTAFVVWVGQHEPAWLADHAAALIRLRVASKGRLQRVVSGASQAIQDRMAAALAGA